MQLETFLAPGLPCHVAPVDRQRVAFAADILFVWLAGLETCCSPPASDRFRCAYTYSASTPTVPINALSAPAGIAPATSVPIQLSARPSKLVFELSQNSMCVRRSTAITLAISFVAVTLAQPLAPTSDGPKLAPAISPSTAPQDNSSGASQAPRAGTFPQSSASVGRQGSVAGLPLQPTFKESQYLVGLQERQRYPEISDFVYDFASQVGDLPQAAAYLQQGEGPPACF